MRAPAASRSGSRAGDANSRSTSSGAVASAPGSPERQADRIRVRLWTRRCLTRAEEDALASGLDRARADQPWTWTGAVLCGDICSEEELSVGDLMDHLCRLQSLPGLARIDLSQPHCSDDEPLAWLRVRRNTPDLQPLCDLYRERLLTAEAVIGALGGFVAQSALDARADRG